MPDEGGIDSDTIGCDFGRQQGGLAQSETVTLITEGYEAIMAKVQSNLIIHGLSGMLGKQVVIKRQKNGQYVVAAAPGAHGGELSEAQKQQREKFRQAILYAKAAHNTAEYQELAQSRGQSTYNVAVADFLHPPEIQGIDLSAYKGAPNEQIKITAVDDVKVKTVGVMIVTDDGTLVEKGAAVATDAANQWLYTTTGTAPSASVKVVVDVADLAGQVTEVTQHN